jgi:hypothetical protein
MPSTLPLKVTFYYSSWTEGAYTPLASDAVDEILDIFGTIR